MSDAEKPNPFPDMQPIRTAPSLGTVNGIGCTVVGSRNYDPATGTYVKTHCLCVLFVPVVALGAYRVADAQQGWYFLGRVPLSRFAKTWNWCLVGLVLWLIGSLWWSSHTSSAAYVARARLNEADQLVADGKPGSAAQLYRDVALGGTEHASTAAGKIKDLLDQSVAQAPPAEAVSIFQVALECRALLPDGDKLFERGLAVAQQHADTDPRAALQLVEAVAPAAPRPTAVTPHRQKLLEVIVTREPNDPGAASQLAVIYDEQKDLPRCEKLLTPHRDRLGSLEGARILGQIYAQQGKFEPALPLLLAYTDAHLKQLHDAEQDFQTTWNNAHRDLVEALNKRQVGDFPYARHQAANETQKQELVDDYLNTHLRDRADVKAALDAIRTHARVVPVAMDLGTVLLQRGQTLPDPAARRAELEKAEKTFLAVRGMAGQSDKFRLSLGQVYYWLGKHDEGKQLFDELLKNEKRSAEALLAVAHPLREVGLSAEARALIEEAYNKDTNQATKYAAAEFRSVLHVDLDDEILWLGRADPSSPHIKASLCSARGQKALQDGNDTEAAAQFRQSIDVYDKQAETAATLNNGALACFMLFSVTGEREVLDRGVARMDRALALQPSDTILLGNAAHTVLDAAVRDIIGSDLDMKLLKAHADLDLLRYLYRDKVGRDRYVERVRKHPGIAKVVTYLERRLILAPKSAGTYYLLLHIHAFTENTDALGMLQKRLDETPPDLSDEIRATLKAYKEDNDPKRDKEAKAAQERADSVLKAARKGPRGATFAVAADRVISLQITAATSGSVVDADAAVKLAEEAHAAAPSRGTHSTLRSALLLRASQKLAAKEPAYTEFLAKGRHTLGPAYLIPLAVARPGALRDAVLANEDVKRTIDLEKEIAGQFGDEARPKGWMLLRAADPDAAAKVGAFLQKPATRLLYEVTARVMPYSAGGAYETAWVLECAGEPELGRKVLKRCQELGVPLPVQE
jgi:tetratricopeptide (TPR) repeat protein